MVEKTLKDYNLCCPNCGKDSDLRVSMSVRARITDNGPEELDTGWDWTDDHAAYCGDCNWSGVASHLTPGGK